MHCIYELNMLQLSRVRQQGGNGWRTRRLLVLQAWDDSLDFCDTHTQRQLCAVKVLLYICQPSKAVAIRLGIYLFIRF